MDQVLDNHHDTVQANSRGACPSSIYRCLWRVHDGLGHYSRRENVDVDGMAFPITQASAALCNQCKPGHCCDPDASHIPVLPEHYHARAHRSGGEVEGVHLRWGAGYKVRGMLHPWRYQYGIGTTGEMLGLETVRFPASRVNQ